MKNPFDELAKTLAIAKGVPRRDALRLIGGGLAGAVLASFGLGKAFGQGNSQCADFCKSVFPPGPARGSCISDAAHHGGLCYECGPAAPPDSGRVLCGQVCCAEGEVCQDDTCVNPNVCFTGRTECQTAPICGNNALGFCICFHTTEGLGSEFGSCVSDFSCNEAQSCTTSADCPSGQVCTTLTCCDGNFCAPLCDGSTEALRTNSLGGGLMASGRVS